MAMVPLLSQSWSCSSLMGANDLVQSHYSQLRSESLSEEEMVRQLKVTCLYLGAIGIDDTISNQIPCFLYRTHMIKNDLI